MMTQPKVYKKIIDLNYFETDLLVPEIFSIRSKKTQQMLFFETLSIHNLSEVV